MAQIPLLLTTSKGEIASLENLFSACQQHAMTVGYAFSVGKSENVPVAVSNLLIANIPESLIRGT